MFHRIELSRSVSRLMALVLVLVLALGLVSLVVPATAAVASEPGEYDSNGRAIFVVCPDATAIGDAVVGPGEAVDGCDSPSLAEALAAAAGNDAQDDVILLHPGYYCPVDLPDTGSRLYLQGIPRTALSSGGLDPVASNRSQVEAVTFAPYATGSCAPIFNNAVLRSAVFENLIFLSNLGVDGASAHDAPPTAFGGAAQIGIELTSQSAFVRDVVVKHARTGLRITGGSVSQSAFVKNVSIGVETAQNRSTLLQNVLIAENTVGTGIGHYDGASASTFADTLVNVTVTGNKVGLDRFSESNFSTKVINSLIADNTRDCSAGTIGNNGSSRYNVVGLNASFPCSYLALLSPGTVQLTQGQTSALLGVDYVGELLPYMDPRWESGARLGDAAWCTLTDQLEHLRTDCHVGAISPLAMHTPPLEEPPVSYYVDYTERLTLGGAGGDSATAHISNARAGYVTVRDVAVSEGLTVAHDDCTLGFLPRYWLNNGGGAAQTSCTITVAAESGQAPSAPFSGALRLTTNRGLITIPVGLSGAGFSISPTEGPRTGGTQVTVTPPAAEAIEFTAVSSSGRHTLGIGADGKTYAWGDNYDGQLGSDAIERSPAPVEVPTPDGVSFVDVAVGGSHSLAIGSDGKTYAWGLNGNGQLGHGAHQPSTSTPTEVTVPEGVTFGSVSAGDGHSLAIGSDGKTYAWGLNYYGQLGNDEHSDRGEPVEVLTPEGVTFTEVAAGWMHSAAIGSDGNAYAWGLNTNGQVADQPDAGNLPTPTRVELPEGVTATSIDVGGYYSVSLGSDGIAYQWGNQTRPDQPSRNEWTPVPVLMPDDLTLTTLSAGHDHALAIGADLKTYAWGKNQYGQLGDGSISAFEEEPVAVSLPAGVQFSQVDAGSFRSFAIDDEGGVFHWGDVMSTGSDMPLVPTWMSAVGVTGVLFGGVAGASLSPSEGVWTVTTPAHAVGTVNVVLGWSLGGVTQQPLTLVGGFTFTPVPPGAPTGVTGAPGNGQVELSWVAPGDDGGSPVADYLIEFSTDDGATWTAFSSGTSAETHATVTDLDNGVAHVFRVAAVNTAGAGPASTPSASVTPVGPGVTYLGSFGGGIGPLNQRLRNPSDVAVSADGSVYVADGGNQRVAKYTATGTFLRGAAVFNFSGAPEGIAVGPDGDVYVTNTSRHQVQRFTALPSYVTSWGTLGTAVRLFSYPDGIATGPDGSVYVVDAGNNRVQKFTEAGVFMSTWGTHGSGPGQFDIPRGIAVAADGTVYVTDPRNSRVQRFTANGQFLGAWGSPGAGQGQLGTPTGVGVASDGTVYVLDAEHRRVTQLTADLDYISTWNSGDDGSGVLVAPVGLGVGPDDSIYIVEAGENDLVRRYVPTRLLPPGVWTPGTPTISGTAQAGHALTAYSGSWLPVPDSIAYQWLRDGAPIAGATAAGYESTSVDAGTRLSVRVTVSKAGYEPASATSAPTDPLAVGVIAGGLQIGPHGALVGDTMRAFPAFVPASAAVTYQWTRNNVPIPGATGVTYTLVGADGGTIIGAEATASAPGFESLTVSASPRYYIMPALLSPPILGIGVNGAVRSGSIVTAHPGEWTPTPSGFSYQWLSNGMAIPGATSSSYLIAPADVGKSLSVRVTASRPDYPSNSATSPARVVAQGTPLTWSTPWITGAPQEGAVLTANTGNWNHINSNPVTYAYQWLRDGTPIAGATAKTYALTAADVGSHVRVSVSGSALGFHPSTHASEPVGPVAPVTPPPDQGGATMSLTDANGEPVTEAEQGEELSGTVDGYAEDSEVDGFGYSAPVHLGTWTTDSTGSATIRFIVPTTLEPGPHTFVFIGVNGEGEVASISQTILITAARGPLAVTGSGDGSLLVGIGVLMIVAGLAIRRRRRHGTR